MKITKLVLGECITNVYIVSSDKKNAVLIDPADEAEKIIEAIESEGLNLQYIFITHGHTDHILALKEVKEHFNVPVVISKVDAWRLEDEELINERPYVKVPYTAVKPDILINEGDEFEVDELIFTFYAMPGHTEGSMAIVVGDNIFTGDTLLFENHGKTTLPGGDEKLLIQSINRMMEDFAGEYKIYTGHRAETTLEHERQHNPYVTKLSYEEVADVHYDYTADVALKRLKEGNQRYATSQNLSSDVSKAVLRNVLDNGQHPYAIIVACSDSRVIPEMIFSAGIGELFVIRVAGNVMDAHQLGSIEYAAEHLGTGLIVVLGHNHCGAVDAALNHQPSGYIKFITDEIVKAIGKEKDEYTACCLNVRHSCEIIEKSLQIQKDEKEFGLKVCGAIYRLEDGVVEFLD